MNNILNKGPKFGVRHVQSLLLFLAMMAIYFSRWNIGITIVAMTNAEIANPNFPEFKWSEKEKYLIVSSLYWAYIVTQIPGGVLCRRYGVKIVLGLAVFNSAILSALTPWSVSWGSWQSFCIIRFLQGLCQGVIFPCFYEHLAKWSPVEERNRLGAFSHTGLDCGIVMAMGLSGIIAKGPLGWPGISYVTAGISFIWCVLWIIFGANNACESNFIKQAEKYYIQTSLDHADDFYRRKMPIPWKALCTSLPFLAYVMVRCAEIWGISILELQIPSYMSGVLNLHVESKVLFATLLFTAGLLMSYVFLVVAEVLRYKNILTLTSLRKLFNSISFWTPSICLNVMGLLNEDNKNWALGLMIISVALNSANIIGSSLNILDLAPSHAGILFSFVNTIASSMALITPVVVDNVVTDIGDRSQWQTIFAITAGFFFVGNLLYVVFGRTETQPWNDEDYLLTQDMENSSTV